MSDPMKIVLLGKTGHGKSSSGNTILGDSTREKFDSNSSPNSVTSKCKVLTGLRPGKETQIKIIDTPGFFDTGVSDEELKHEIVRCITTCAPGPHAFIIVLKVDRYTEQEKATVAKITRAFGEDAFQYSAVLFTHGDDLDEGKTIEQFVEQSKELKELVEKCGGGCHVIDNKYWNQEHKYRSNTVQVEKLLNTIEKMVRQNGGDCYTNEMLQAVEEAIQREEEEIRKEWLNEEIGNVWLNEEIGNVRLNEEIGNVRLNEEIGNVRLNEEIRNKLLNEMSKRNFRDEAAARVENELLFKCAGLAVAAITGAFFGIGACVASMMVGWGITAAAWAKEGGIVGFQKEEDVKRLNEKTVRKLENDKKKL